MQSQRHVTRIRSALVDDDEFSPEHDDRMKLIFRKQRAKRLKAETERRKVVQATLSNGSTSEVKQLIKYHPQTTMFVRIIYNNVRYFGKQSQRSGSR